MNLTTQSKKLKEKLEKSQFFHLSTVDFEVTAGDGKFKIFVFWGVEKLEDVFGGKSVDAILGILLNRKKILRIVQKS